MPVKKQRKPRRAKLSPSLTLSSISNHGMMKPISKLWKRVLEVLLWMVSSGVLVNSSQSGKWNWIRFNQFTLVYNFYLVMVSRNCRSPALLKTIKLWWTIWKTRSPDSRISSNPWILLLSIRSKQIWRYLRPVRDRGPNPPNTILLLRSRRVTAFIQFAQSESLAPPRRNRGPETKWIYDPYLVQFLVLFSCS